jgi:tRNA threonylcarbamoyladenosine modification (KEOPS) complex  Pcc1 subunit
LEIREVNNAIIQINTFVDLEALKDQEDIMKLLKELEKLPSKQRKLQLLKKSGVEVVAKIIKMNQNTLAEVDKLIEESDSAMKKLRYSFKNIDLQDQNFTRTIFTRFNAAQLDLLDARRELVSLASETIQKCKKIELRINNWEEKYAARLYKSQFKELKRLVEKTKSTIKIAREKYDSLRKNWVKIDEDIETFKQKVDRALDRNSAEYKRMISKLEEDKPDVGAWQIGAVFLDIFGCFGFCSTLVVDQKKEASRKIDAQIKEYEDEMGKMSNKVKEAYKTIQRLDSTSGTAINLLTLEENLVILWETAAIGMEDTIEDLSEATLEEVKDANFFKVQFAESVADLRSAAENFLRFVNPDNPSLLN